MATTISLIDSAYEFVKSKESATFEQIWTAIGKNIKEPNDVKQELLADLYGDMVLDNRFALTGDGKWGLRENLKLEDVKKQYDFIDHFDTTDEFEKFDLDTLAGDEMTIDIDEDDSNDDDSISPADSDSIIFDAEDSYDDGKSDY